MAEKESQRQMDTITYETIDCKILGINERPLLVD